MDMEKATKMVDLEPLTITQLPKSPENSAMSALAMAKVRELILK